MRIALLLATAVLAAGCLEAQSVGSLPGHHVSKAPIIQATSPDNNVHFTGTISECEAGYCVDATASNHGSADIHVSNLCVTPFHEDMLQDGDPVQHREPIASCDAFQTEPFSEGEERRYQSAWEAQIWNDGYSDAPAGDYTWIVTFRYWETPHGGTPIDLVLEFPIEITA